MQTADRLLLFPTRVKLRPAKATLSDDTRAGVDRLIAMAPILGKTNPEGVPVVEHVMQNLIAAPAPDDDGGHQESVIDRQVSTTHEAEYHHRHRHLQAQYQAMFTGQELINEWIERQRARSEQTIRMLKDQAGDLSAAS